MAHPRHQRRPHRPGPLSMVLRGIGVLLITSGLVIALLLVSPLWWTGLPAHDPAPAVMAQLTQTQVASPPHAGP